MLSTEEAIVLWKANNITECICEFSCGGDSMNDIDFYFHTKEGKVDLPELTDYFDSEVYNNVEFYVNSDGHYIGEAGEVVIVLEDDEEDFSYTKNAESEWSETFSDVGNLKLTKDYEDFLKTFVESIIGGQDGSPVINYKSDCILSDREEEIAEELTKELNDFADEFGIEGAEGEPSDWYTFSTNVDNSTDVEDVEGSTLVIEDSKLRVRVQRQYYVYRPSED